MHQFDNIIPNDLTIARSGVLDAFAELEYEVAEAVKALGGDTGHEGAPLGQKLDKLAGLKAGPMLSKENSKIITEAAKRGLTLCEIRNDVVHSKLRFVSGHPEIAIYINARIINQPYPTARVMTVTQHQTLAREITVIAECINAWRCKQKK